MQGRVLIVPGGMKGLVMADISIARQGGTATAAPSETIRLWLIPSALMMLALLAPALWNGFPLIFPDTGGYLSRPIEGTLTMGRSALYGWFLYISMPLLFWPVIVAQAATMIAVVLLALRSHGLGGRPWLTLGIVTMLSFLTSLPWFAAQLMPDILFPAAVLALHLLVFRTAQLNAAERLGLVALIATAVACHMAALGLCIGLVAALWLLSRIQYFALPVPRIGYAAGAAAAGIALCLISNFAIAGSATFTPGGSSFLFGRLVEDGIAARYLGDRCPDPTLRICQYAKTLPANADDWLWGPDTAFYKLGGPAGFGPEATRIIVGSLQRYPLMHAAAAALATLEQFAKFKTEISFENNEPTFETFREDAPDLLAPLMQARQQTAPFDVAALNIVHVPVAALSIAALAAVFMFRRRLGLTPDVTALCLSILLALAINAAVCGVFSHPVDRYQSRLVVLAPFALALAFAAHRRNADSS